MSPYATKRRLPAVAQTSAVRGEADVPLGLLIQWQATKLHHPSVVFRVWFQHTSERADHATGAARTRHDLKAT